MTEAEIFDKHLASIRRVPIDTNIPGRPSERIAQACTLNTVTLLQEQKEKFEQELDAMTKQKDDLYNELHELKNKNK